MTSPDPVLARLADLSALDSSPELSSRLRAAAHARLRPRPVHSAWTVVVAAVVVSYLGWALQYSSSLY